MMNKIATSLVTVAVLSALGGCAGPATKVTDITKDQPTYLAQHFTPDKLPVDVTSQLKNMPAANIPYRTLEVKLDLTTHKINPVNGQDKDVNDTVDNRFENLGNGYLRVSNETASNGVPFGTNLMLTYVGYLTLSLQFVNYGQMYASRLTPIDKITRIDGDIVNPKEDSATEADVVATGVDTSFKCQSGKFYPAKNLLAKLEGNALDLDCNYSRQGILLTKSKMVYLQKYGTYMVVETDNTNYSNVFKITDVIAN